MTKRLYPDQAVVGVGAVILNDGKILLGKRLNEPGRGKWSIPGGVVEIGETLQQAVIRETKEETNLEVSDPVLLDVVDSIEVDEHGKVKYHFVIVDYFVKVKNGSVKADSDAEELVWVPLDEVEKHVLTASFRFFFKSNKEKLKALNSYS